MGKKYAILLAGGSGLRMGLNIPKQFLELGNVPVIVRSLKKFEGHDKIDGIILVVHRDYVDSVEKLAADFGLKKIKAILAGGITRQESSYKAITGYDFSEDDILLFHDAVRPFVSDEIIDRVIEEVSISGAAAVCVKSTDTVFMTDSEGFIASIPDRRLLFNAQTPQGFKFEIINKAHQLAIESGIADSSDDVRLVMAMGVRVRIVNGSYENIKITTISDMKVASTFLEE